MKNKTLTVDAGSTYSEVCGFLAAHSSLALPNTASLPHFSVAGACATGTHGSSGMGSDGRLSLSGAADAVASIELIGPEGDLRTVRTGEAGFEASVVSLGLMGIASKVTLNLVDAYHVRQRVYGACASLRLELRPSQSESGNRCACDADLECAT